MERTRKSSNRSYLAVSATIGAALLILDILVAVEVIPDPLPSRIHGVLLGTAVVLGVVGLIGHSLARIVSDVYWRAYWEAVEDTTRLTRSAGCEADLCVEHPAERAPRTRHSSRHLR